jgi:hypothetical protein
MNKSIADFVEQYVQGEELTPRTVQWAIRKYIYMNYSPSKQEQLERYQLLLHRLAALHESGDTEGLESLLRNIYMWSIARKSPEHIEDEELRDDAAIQGLQNETFYNLLN